MPVTGGKTTRWVAASALVPLTALALGAVPVRAEPVTGTAVVSWRPCATAVKDWAAITDGDTAMECAMVPVPLDYADPGGRQIGIAVSRLKATAPAKRRGALLVNPGGPGGSTITFPLNVADSGLAELGTDHDLIGFDPRGVGYSDRIVCAGEPLTPPVTTTDKDQARYYFDRERAFNERCAPQDLAFTRQLTTANMARDVDAIRVALGEQKISFFGVSWSTALGANYRSLFDDHVDRMWLDSVMPPVMDLEAMDDSIAAVHEKSYAAFAAWLARHDGEFHLGGTVAAVTRTIFALRDTLTSSPRVSDAGGYQSVFDGAAVTRMLGITAGGYASVGRDLATLHEGGVPGVPTAAKQKSRQTAPGLFGLDADFEFFNDLQYRAVMCNDGVGGRDFDTVWANRQKRAQRYPATGGAPENARQCPSWPVPAQPWQLTRGSSALQLSGHLDEDVTPYAWAVAMQAKVGGALLTVPDDQHGSLKGLPCASKVVDFFRTGRTTNGSCPPTSSVAAPAAPAAPSTGDLSGTVDLRGCSGSLVRMPNSVEGDRALLLTNGHCFSGARPIPDEVLVNQPASAAFDLLSADGGRLGTLRATRAVYVSMTGTDVTLYRLTETYAQLKREYGVRPLEVSGQRPAPGTPIRVVSGGLKRTYSCRIDRLAYRVLEAAYLTKDVIRYTPECDTGPGTSGSPIVEAASGRVIGVNNTSNREGNLCTENNPCEMDRYGAVSARKGASYGTQTYWITTCMAAGNRLDLRLPGCLLPKPS